MYEEIEMKYFDKNSRISEIIEKYPNTIPVFISKGFKQMADEDKRNTFAKNISLGMALSFKKLDFDTFSKLLIEAIEENSKEDLSLRETDKKNSTNSLKIMGLFPCPVKVPLIEEFTSFVEEYTENSKVEVDFDLKSASMGLDWIKEDIKDLEDLSTYPDILISPGFDLFFDRERVDLFEKSKIFQNSIKYKEYNRSFDGLNLEDPRSYFSLLGVVPAIFMVNLNELGDRPIPLTWSDILKPEFEKRVSLPVKDFVMFHGILLNIHKIYGDEGVIKLGKSLLESLHPAQMLKSERIKTEKPIITIMPYFFTKMAGKNSNMKVIWPKDGAIISPLFMLAKNDRLEKSQEIIDFFGDRKIAEILSHRGFFPSVNPDIDNNIEKENRFMWLGWDYIYNNNMKNLIEHCEKIFYQNSDEKSGK
ncbi:MAG: spermidine/putrescine ABC transporter substrate-binding protein [Candidatus Cloacimonadota bacterium]|nr:MAG: spermidine/putrescine ABC transporter substrate-binding protein [Candidatus Cloacimonadota bacterium]PIE79445.1 MAG: spermidine/putrescine ABC transporter substrate-binding protein [Candidatus Delongbacteria bacterium]